MGKVILYIEDNAQNMRLVRKMLKIGGYEMIEAMDGMTGLQLVASKKPDLILLDINLPDIDGLEITQRLKSNPELDKIPIVALTANAMFGDRERIIEAGCDDYIAKPVSKKELLTMVKLYIGEAE